MKFLSTRDSRHSVGLSEAIAAGIAPDGGLYVPETFPAFAEGAWPASASLPAIAQHLITPFAAGDRLEGQLAAVTGEAFNFEAPLIGLRNTPGPAGVLELFHGPTSAFKDFGARFLAATLQRIEAADKAPSTLAAADDAGDRGGAQRLQLGQGLGRAGNGKLTILVATSGDTGGAVAAAFHRRPGFEVAVLYPKGLVSERQARQLSCWGDNIRTFAVQGTFDDCQRTVKEAFHDASLAATHRLSSANSINVGRLLPQMVYYARASLDVMRRTGRKANFIIPAGNLGNSLACVWARKAGLPIGDIVLATNGNTTIGDYLRTGEWRPRQSVATLASAMDVGNPSNMERLRALYPQLDELRTQVSAFNVSDDEIRATIVRDDRELGQVWCPHTATAAHVYRKLMTEGAASRENQEWIIVATAHPAKFNDIVEPLIGRAVPVPPQLARLLEMPRLETPLEPTLAALRRNLQETVRS